MVRPVFRPFLFPPLVRPPGALPDGGAFPARSPGLGVLGRGISGDRGLIGPGRRVMLKAQQHRLWQPSGQGEPSRGNSRPVAMLAASPPDEPTSRRCGRIRCESGADGTVRMGEGCSIRCYPPGRGRSRLASRRMSARCTGSPRGLPAATTGAVSLLSAAPWA